MLAATLDFLWKIRDAASTDYDVYCQNPGLGLRLGVENNKNNNPHKNLNWSLTLKTKSCLYIFKFKVQKSPSSENFGNSLETFVTLIS